MESETNEERPFLVAQTDGAARTLNRIDSWPSFLCTSSLPQEVAVHSADEMLNKFRSLPVSIQEEFAAYPLIVKQAFQSYAASGDLEDAVNWLVGQLPGMLFRTSQTECPRIPMEVALEAGNVAAVMRMLDTAQQHSGLLDRLLGYRNRQFGHTMLMLAVHLNSRKDSFLIHTMLSFDPCALHRCYDNRGRNVFHICAQSGLSVAFQIIFGLLIEFPDVYSTIGPLEVKNALEMTDSDKYTPLHYISSTGKTDMFATLKTFLDHVDLTINFDTCFKCGNTLTPLMIGVKNGHFEVCEWLLENGSVDVHFKQHSTCLTALHFAVRAGNPELIALLMRHGADPEFYNSYCDYLDDYKTPLELARTESIRNKDACIRCLETR